MDSLFSSLALAYALLVTPYIYKIIIKHFKVLVVIKPSKCQGRTFIINKIINKCE